MTDRDDWAARFRIIITGAGDDDIGEGMSRADALKHNDSISTAVAPMTPRPGSMNSVTDKTHVSRGRKGSMLFGKTFSQEFSSAVNINEQSKQVGAYRKKAADKGFMGNLPIETLSLFSMSSYQDMEFFGTMQSWCAGGKAQATKDVIQHILDKGIYDFSLKEGEVLVQQGQRFRWVYFVIKGEVGRRKEWGGSRKVIAKPVKAGKIVGDLECILFDGVSPHTLIIGPGTCVMRIRRSEFVNEFKSDAGNRDLRREGIFSRKFMDQEADPSNDRSDESFAVCYKRYCMDMLSCHPLFEKHPKESVQEMASLFYPLLFPAGATLIREEDVSAEFFLVVEGTCNIFKKNVHGDSELVHSTRSGDWLGEAGLSRQSRRNATVLALTDVIVLKTDAKGFKRFMDNGGPMVRHAVERSVTNHMATSIRGIPLFQDLDDKVIESICVCMSVKELQADSVIVPSDTNHDSFYVIMHGFLNGSIQESGDFSFKMHPPIVDVISENDFLGEGWILLSSYSSEVAYFTPVDRVVALCASTADFKAVVDSCPALRLRLEARLERRRSRIEMVHSLTSVIAASITRSGNDGPSGDSTDSATAAELTFLRAEVARLGGHQYLPVEDHTSLSSLSSNSSLSVTPLKDGIGSKPRRASMRMARQFSSGNDTISSSPAASPPAPRAKSPARGLLSLFSFGGGNSSEKSTAASTVSSSHHLPTQNDFDLDKDRDRRKSERRSSTGGALASSAVVNAALAESSPVSAHKSKRRWASSCSNIQCVA
jgi:CRP-like cAMP-binding protein